MPIVKYLCCFLMVCLGQASLFAQAISLDEAVPEQMYVHLDKPFYATGESMWYKVYFLNQQESNSEILYVDLIDPAGNLVTRQKLEKDRYYAHGNIEIPFTWQEGYYLLRCYTLWNLNFGAKAIFSRHIPIYNPWDETKTLSTPEDDTDMGQITVDSSQRQAQDLRIKLQADRDSYDRKEEVQLSITVTDANQNPVEASLSLAVTDMSLIPAVINTAIKQQSAGNTFADSALDRQEITYAPEKSLKLQADILAPGTAQPVTTEFLSVYFVEKQTFVNTAINQGQLQINIPHFEGSQTVQIHNHNPFQASVPSVQLDHRAALLPQPERPATSPPRDASVEKYLYYSKLRRKLEEIFEAETPPSSLSPSSGNGVLPLQPDKSYLMQDFQLLKNVEEFIDHVFTKVRIVKKDGRKTVRLFDPNAQKFLEDQPWYMINGYLTAREEAVLQIPVQNIERLDVFYRRSTITQYFPPLMIRNGVVAIYTKDRKKPEELMEANNTFTWEGLAQPKDFELPATRRNTADKVPDFRPLVFWHPQILANNSGQATVTFPTTEAVGRFLIYVEAVSKEGKTGTGYTTYMVEFPNP